MIDRWVADDRYRMYLTSSRTNHPKYPHFKIENTEEWRICAVSAEPGQVASLSKLKHINGNERLQEKKITYSDDNFIYAQTDSSAEVRTGV